MRLLRRTLRFIVLTTLALAAIYVIQLPRSEEAALARVERMAANTTADGHWPSLSVAYVAPGEVLWAESFGFADIEAGRGMTPQTPMPIGSISKVLIGLVAVLEAERGFDVDAPLGSYWSDAPATVAALTFRDLATHTAGIRDTDAAYEAVSYAQNTLKHPMPLATFIDGYFTPGDALYDASAIGITAPGVAYEYSNVGAALAAQALAEASGTGFDALTQTRVFDPLGLNIATWDATTLPEGTRAQLYEHRDGSFEALAPYALATWPDGGLNTTLDALAKLLATLMAEGTYAGERLLPAGPLAQQQEIATTGLENMYEGQADGLFWAYEMLPFPLVEIAVDGHSGGDPGLLTMMYRVAGTDRGFVLMVNGYRESDWSLLQAARMITTLARAAKLGSGA